MKKIGRKKKLCGCWDSSPGLHGHNVEFLPLNYSHLMVNQFNIYIFKPITRTAFKHEGRKS
ncbi:hypothetical protein MTR_4g119090 [Medicago truncatula]|uniref:Uncharacterized protein n=1 Tax=Medicago truncatula TaxID=3880 RepID=G7JJ52_MEDTR|nr:hypothetical protein MTR_4g119090 [Medicago truncatula]